jgi:hypothetical protein
MKRSQQSGSSFVLYMLFYCVICQPTEQGDTLTMPRIQPADLAQMPNFASNGSSTMTQLFKTMGHRPELMRDAMQLVETAMRTGTVETQLKELIAIRVSQVNNCFY